MARHLFYTLALDNPPGAVGHRLMARFLVLSLLRTRFDGDIVVFKNSAAPLFRVPREGVREIQVETQQPEDEEFWDYAQSWKFRVRRYLDAQRYDKVLFLDADCLVLRDLTPLLDEDWDIACFPEPGSRADMDWFNTFIAPGDAERGARPGINGGVLGVRGAHFDAVLAEWERTHFGPSPRRKFFNDQAALTRLVIDTPLRVRMISTAEHGTPFAHTPHPNTYFNTHFVHLAGSGNFADKLRFMYGLYMSTFFFDPQTTFAQMLDF